MAGQPVFCVSSGGLAGLLRLLRSVFTLFGSATPIADVREQRRPGRPYAEVPMNVMRRRTPGAEGAGVDSMEVMRRAHRGAVRTLVTAAA